MHVIIARYTLESPIISRTLFKETRTFFFVVVVFVLLFRKSKMGTVQGAIEEKRFEFKWTLQ